MIKMTCSRKEEPILARTPSLAWSVVAVLVTIGVPARAQMQLVTGITTVAGNGTAGSSGDGGAATSAELNGPTGVVLDSAGNYYIPEFNGNRVRKVTIATGIISTVAGTGTAGFSGDGGQATSAELDNPNSVAVDSAGNLYIADLANNRIRKVTASSGVITTVAGNGTAGYSGDSGQATSAELNEPSRIDVDSSGNIYIADSGNNRIRKVTAATGVITTVAGNGTYGYSGDSGQATSAELAFPTAVIVDGSGNLYIADYDNERIREVTISTGVITTVAGDGTKGFSGDGGAATSAEINLAYTLAVGTAGYIADSGNFRIRMVNLQTGVISTIAGDGAGGYSGDGGVATSAALNYPNGMDIDHWGNLYFADSVNSVIRKLTFSANLPTIEVGSSSTAENVFLQTTSAETLTSITAAQSQNSKQEYAVGSITGCTVNGSTSNASGTVCKVPVTFSPAYPGVRNVPLAAVTGTGNVTFGLSGTGTGPLVGLTPGIISTVAGNGTSGETGNGGAATSAELNAPNRMAVDSAGNLYIADLGGNVIRKVTASTGLISTVAGNGTAGFTGDGGAATSAEISSPNGVAVDAAGNIYISDFGNNRIRKVTVATGIINTVAGTSSNGFSGDGGLATSAKLFNPSYVALDSAGNIYIADFNNNRIREVTAATGIINTIAGNGTRAYAGDGGAATSAELNAPVAVVVDASGNFYIAEYNGARVRKVTVGTGIITTVAGNGTAGYSGDGGAATSAEMNVPQGVALDVAGNLYIADSSNNRVRKVENSTQIITTVAGNGTSGYSGDNGAATSAELWLDNDVAVDSAGNLYIVDRSNSRIRKIQTAQSALTFPTSTTVGTLDATDDPQTVAIDNIGNDELTISTPGAGSNPSVAAYFELDAATTCPQLSTSSSPQTIAAGSGCNYAVDFAPTVAGSISGSLVLTDNSLGVAGTTQTTSLTGTAGSVGTTTTVSSTANPSTYSAMVTFTATVSVSSGTDVPTGTVQFSIDGSNVGSAVTLSGGIGTYSISTLTAGTHSVKAVYTTGSSSFTGSTSSTLSQVVSKATPTITWANPSAIAYGTALSATQLNATASAAGSFVYSPASGTVLGAGSQTLNVTFTPTDTTDYNSNTASVTLTVNKATPTITWATPSAITYGTALSSTQLNATASAAGSFVYSPASGVVLGAGSQTLGVTFTPTDTTDYNSNTASVTLTVNKATPTLMWTTPSAITYGTALSSTQLDATASVPGTFVYSPAAGTVLSAGAQTLSVTFTPTDTVDYSNASTTMTLTVNKATPTLMWSTPAAITYGTALSSTQLDATASVPGSFVYSPASGTVLGAGSQTLSVTFTPTDFTDYNNASTTMALTVNKATPTVTWANPSGITYGTALSSTQLNATASTPGTFVYSPASGTVLGAGSQTLGVTFTPTDATDYNSNTASVTLTVNKATPTITWANPSGITYGTALSSTQLNATASTAGTFVYSPASGTVLGAGSQTLSVTFTPTDTTDYNGKTATATLVVSKATPTITWANPSGITYGTALSSTQLNATASTVGTFVYSPASGTVLSAGSQRLSVTFTPTDSTDYNSNTATATLVVSKATAAITWATPAAITYGTALSATQLNATASTAGSFVYSPASGTVLNAGSQTLGVTFTPTDTTDYNSNSASVTLLVNPAAKTITFPQPTTPVNVNATGTLTATASNGDAVTYTITSGTASLAGSNITYTNAGSVTIAANSAATANYSAAATVSDTVTVNAAAYSSTAPTTAIGATSAAQTASVNLAASATLGTISVVTQGATGLDYAYVTGGSCAVGTAYTSGEVCTVNYTFAPLDPGLRYGAVVLLSNDSTPVLMGTAYLTGTGTGPLTAMTPGVISTVAGNGTAGYTGNGGAATSAEFNNPNRVAIDSAGNIFIADSANNVVRKVTASTGFISTVAGTGTAGYSGDGGAATSAKLNDPNGVSVDGAGNIYIADYSNNRVREVTVSTGVITTVAGNGTQGYSGDGGQATSAELYTPGGATPDGAGNLYIADAQNNRIRKVNLTTGVITTVAGTGTAGYSGDGGAATSAKLFAPVSVAFDSSGNYYIADYENNVVRKVTIATGIITTVAGTGTAGYSGDGGPATSAKLYLPCGVSLDATGNLYIADSTNYRIRKVDNGTNHITTVAGTGTAGYTGNGGAATSATLKIPNDVAVSSVGALYIADSSNNVIRKVDVSQSKLTFSSATAVGTTDSTDDPQTATVGNIGNASLTVATPSSGTNPSVTAPFQLDSSTTCPQLNTSSAAGTLTGGQSCIYAVDFAPTAAGSISGSLVLTDNSLTVTGTTQTVTLAATAIAVGTTTTVASSANPSTYPASVTFTATIAPASGSAVPTGTVQFSIDGSNVGSAVTLSGSDTATYTTSTLTGGAHSVQAVYTSNSANYTGSTSAALTQTVNKATPTITWANPSSITYGTALSSTQLNATASTPGTLVYSPASGTVLGAGSQTLNVTFTPTDTTDYNSNTATVTLVVSKATPTITWANPSSITYGTALSSTQLNATASAPGTFVYSPVSGTVLGAGSQTLNVTFTPTDSTDYNSNTATATLVVSKATPTVTWANPAGITYGTALSSTQLNATASTAGTFVYSPASGTVLGAGSQTLSVTFTPTDTTDYNSNTATATLVVSKATPTITWANPAAIAYGTALSGTQLNATASVAGIYVYNPVSGTVLGAGVQTLNVTFTPTDTTDYNGKTASVTLTVNKSTPSISWANPAAITYGTALSGIQLNATAGVPGTLVYNPASGTVLAAGSQTLNVTFTPTDSTDYNSNSASVTLLVSKAAPTLTWSTPAAISYGTALSSTQLDATASVPGSFVYSPAAGTVLGTGSQTLGVTFTPSDASDYNPASTTTTLTVNKSTPTITWANPAAITYGTALSATQLNATASTAGTFVYNPTSGTVLGAGSRTLNVTFTPSDSTDYNGNTASVTLTVNDAVPTLMWTTPSAIVYGTALSSTQLDATASVAGSLVYSPAAGTVLNAGTQTLSVTFTPTDSSDYGTASTTMNLTVTPTALAAAIVGNPTKPYDGSTDATLAPSNYLVTGWIGSDGATVTQTAGTYAAPTPGTQTVSVSLGAGDFTPTGATNLLNYVLPSSASGPGTISVGSGLSFSLLGQTINAYAGQSGASGYTGDGGLAAAATLNAPASVAFDVAGNIYVADRGNSVVRKISQAGYISTYAGTGAAGYSGDGGAATSAQLNGPWGVALDSSGNLYISDTGNNRVRKVTAAGVISTYAGTGVAGYSGDGGAATAAQLSAPYGVAVDSNSNLYIADSGNNRIRQVAAGGNIATYAGNGTAGFAGDGGPAGSAELNSPAGVALDSSGDLYIADKNNNRIRLVDTTRTISTIAGNGNSSDSGDGGPATSAGIKSPQNMAIDAAGNLYIAESGRVRWISTDGSIATFAGNGTLGSAGNGGAATSAELGSLSGIALDPLGQIYLADTTYSVVRLITLDTTFPPTNVSQSSAAQTVAIAVNAPSAIQSIAVPSGYSDFSMGAVSGCTVDGSTINPAGTVCTFSATFTPQYAGWRNAPLILTDGGGTKHTFSLRGIGNEPEFAFFPGIINTFAGTGTAGSTGDGGPATAATLNLPHAVTVGLDGSVYIADFNNDTIRKVDASGVITTIAGTTGSAGYSGDGGPATSAQLTNPTGVNLDNAGNLYIADFGNHVIRKIDANGIITTIAGTGSVGSSCPTGGLATAVALNNPTSTSFDFQGNLYIADPALQCVLEVYPSGYIGMVAGTGTAGYSGDGGPATSAQLNSPQTVAGDSDGDLYIADEGNNVIRMVNPQGVISTVAGNGTAGDTGDYGPATAAEMNQPYGLAVDAADALSITDNANQAVRVVDANGTIYTIVGSGHAGYDGDGGGADTASLYLQSASGAADNSFGVADSNGKSIYIADTGNHAIRIVNLKQTDDLSFPDTPDDTTSAVQSVIVANVGNTALTFSNIAITAGFQLSGTCSTSSPLLPNTICYVGVAYAPTSEVHPNTGTVTITDNSPGSPHTIALAGSNSAEATTSSVSGSPSPASFGATVTLTAAVTTDDQDQPPGTVTFYDGASALGTVTLDPAAVATFSTSSLSLGSHSISAVYSGSANFLASTSPVFTESVVQNAPTVTWAAPAAITYGTALSAAQLNATANVSGTFVYTPAAGAVLGAGSQMLSVTFTPDDLSDYVPVTASVQITVNKAGSSSTITWNNPSAITYGTALSATQLNATSTVGGTFSYSPAAGSLLAAGSQTLNVTFTPTDANDYQSGSASVTLVVNAATLTAAIVGNPSKPYDGTRAGTLTASNYSLAGLVGSDAFTVSQTAGTYAAATAGAETITATLTGANFTAAGSTNVANYVLPSTASGPGTITKAGSNSAITWATPSAITYGTALSAMQLDASASVAGTFSYSPAAGTVLAAGSQNLNVTFTPTDATDYQSGSASVTLTVNPATLSAAIVGNPTKAYDGTRTATLTAANYSLSGLVGSDAFTITQTSGTYAAATVGTEPVTATLIGANFTPTGSTSLSNYLLPSTAAGTGTITKASTNSVITWTTPAAITYGTQLSATQLDATSTVGGTFSYSPADGAVLPVGTQTLNVTFTPTDTTDYQPGSASVSLTVNPATLTATVVGNPTKAYDGTRAATLTASNYSLSGLVGSDAITITQTSGSYAAASAGAEAVTVALSGANFTPTGTTNLANYILPGAAAGPGTITKAATSSTITWTTPAAITYGTALSSTQLNATSTVGGTFSYSPAAGSILAVGTQTLSVTFTPTDSTDYQSGSATVSLTVNPATLTAAVVGNPTKPYDGTRAATLTAANYSLSGLVGSDAITVTQTSGSYAAATAGTEAVTVALSGANFTPTGTTSLANYVLPSAAAGAGTITKAGTSSAITWTTTAAINYGTALSSAQLNATSSLSGTFSYSPGAGSVLAAGTQSLNVTFTPTDSTDYQTGSATVNLTVNPVPLSAAIVGNPTKAYDGTRAATLTASNYSLSGFVGSDSMTVTQTSGTYAAAAAGAENVTAVLSGRDFSPTGATSPANYVLPRSASGPGTITKGVLTASANDATRPYGAANPTFTGTVTGQLPGDSFTESFSTVAVTLSPPGTYAIVPALAGTNLGDYSANIVDGTLTVSQAASRTTLTASSVTLAPGQSVTLTANVASSTSGTPTSNVQFLDGTNVLGSGTLNSGVATCVTTLSTGMHTITAVYGGDANFAGSSGDVSISVTAPGQDFTFALATGSASSQSAAAGSSTQYNLIASPLGSQFAESVAFTLQGLPAGASYSFSPSTLDAGSGSSPITLTVRIPTRITVQQGAQLWSPLKGRAVSPLLIGVMLMPWVGYRRMGRRIRRHFRFLPLLLGLLMLAGIGGCGATHYLNGPPQPQTSILTATATSGSISHSVTLTLVVND